ncbi:hypothetical protein VYU27_010716, partial [Nannochloropsis oceanica]
MAPSLASHIQLNGPLPRFPYTCRLPPPSLQTDPAIRLRWIGYSALDALSTWALREELEKRLKSVHWEREPLDAVGQTDDATMYDFYQRYFVPFATVLTDMERIGIRVDAREYLASVQVQAEKDKEAALE